MPSTYRPNIASTPSGGYELAVHFDWHRAEVHGPIFFEMFAKALEKEFRRTLVVALRAAQKFAPKGDRNYVIEDLDERTRAGGSTRSTPANPRGFAVQADFNAATGHGRWRVRKVPGGTLRRALALMVVGKAEELVGTIGVRAGSPAEKYARITELGGAIVAKKAKYLRYSPDGQTIVFKPVVHRPPHPYLLPALLFAWPLIEAAPVVAFEKASLEFKAAFGADI